MDSGDKKPGPNPIARLALQGWVSLNGFAKIVDVSYPTALKLKQEGKVRTIQVGSQTRVYRSEVERFLREGNYVGGASASPTISGEF